MTTADKEREELVEEISEYFKDWNPDSFCEIADFILTRERTVLREVLDIERYCEHDKRCVCSQWRQGRPTEDGHYETLYGYGKNEKWYRDNEEPKCSCGLTKYIAIIKKRLGEA